MGNFIISPFQSNKDSNKPNENHLIMEGRYPSLNNKQICSNLNDLTDFGENTDNLYKNNNTNKYYYGYKYKKNKKNKDNKLLFQDTKEGIIMNNIRRMSQIIFDKKNDEKNENNNNGIKTVINETNYMKKYNNNEKYYKYGKKSREDKKTVNLKNVNQDNQESKENYNFKNKNRKKKNKSNKNEKSSQFMLLNNNNAFNTLKEINILNSNYKNEINDEIKITSIQDYNQNIFDNDQENIKEKKNCCEDEKIFISNNEDSSINNIENNEFEKLVVTKKKNSLEEDISNIIKIENKIDNEKKIINSKETNNTSEGSILESKLIDNSIYSFNGNILNDKKEGIGKWVYKNRIGLMTIFENNKIIGPIIISDMNGNSFQGYIDENNNLDGYFNLKFNFNKNDIKKKYKSKNNIIVDKNINESKNKDEMIIMSNFVDLTNTYLDLSTLKYNYSHIESIISKNIINNYGIIKWSNNSKYLGEIRNNKKHGIGLFIWPDDSRYEGEFYEDRMEGWGLIHFFDGKIFQGQILNGLPHGYGEFIWTNNNRYFGSYVKGQKEGFGIYIMNNINKTKAKNEIVTYFGFWKNGKQDGYGIIIKNKKIIYVKYKEGKKIRQYDYDIFLGKISNNVNKKYEKIFFFEIKTLKNIIRSIMEF